MNDKKVHAHGFTLIELMIALVVISILAAIALPAYNDYIQRGKMSEAFANLSDMRAKLEQYFQDNRTYVGACASGTAAPLPDSNSAKYFTYSCPVLTATTYTVQADGVASEGMGGFTYTIDQNNAHVTASVPAGWSSSTTCWTIRKDGSC